MLDFVRSEVFLSYQKERSGRPSRVYENSTDKPRVRVSETLMAKRQRLKGAAWLGLGLLVAGACVAGAALLVRGFVAARNDAAAETEREQPIAAPLRVATKNGAPVVAQFTDVNFTLTCAKNMNGSPKAMAECTSNQDHGGFRP